MMADTSPYIILIVIVAVLLVALSAFAMESYKKDLVARGGIMAMIAVLLLIIGLLAFYFVYVLGPAAFSSGVPAKQLFVDE